MRRRHRSVHRAVWLVLSVLLPALLIGALATRHGGPREAPVIQLAPPP